MQLDANVRSTARTICTPLATLDAALVTFGKTHEWIMLALRGVYQIAGLVIAIAFASIAGKLDGVLGFQGFIETAFAGLGLQTSAFGFYNGTVTCVVLLLIAYGVLSVFLVSPARILCDAAALYALFFSSTLPVYQFEAVAAPLAAIWVIWILHRFVLGTVVFRYHKAARYVAAPAATPSAADNNA